MNLEAAQQSAIRAVEPMRKKGNKHSPRGRCIARPAQSLARQAVAVVSKQGWHGQADHGSKYTNGSTGTYAGRISISAADAQREKSY